MIDKSLIDANALHYYRMLKEAGFSAYFVGGSVRDLLLGKVPKDFDIATNATPHQIKRIIPQGRIIGRRFRHVMLERDGGRYEIVTFRGPIPTTEEAEGDNTAEGEGDQDSAQDQERKFPDLNQFGSAQQDAIRRDFTINALFYDPDVDELVDYVDGKIDVDAKVIRTIGDAKVRMQEDPIRILRAIRHKIKLSLAYDPYLIEAIQEKAPLLEETSKDRIREEFLKVCNDRTLGQFLVEAKRLGILHFVAPWFDDTSEEDWNKAVVLWNSFYETPTNERPYADIGLALMITPLVEPLVLAPYRQTVPEGDRNYLPDMKYFLSCETMRNYFLRNLRISRAQTDHIMRALFYWSRMTGLWIENGPPRRVIGRLFQHPPALLAAKMARLQLNLEAKAIPEWLTELADFNPNHRQQHQRQDRPERGERQERSEGRGDNRRPQREPRHENQEQNSQISTQENDENEVQEESGSQNFRLPPPDQPMVWNGPLHAPVLRPTFSEEALNRWARKNQTVYAYRPSGIPNQPIDYAMLKSNTVSNYKPELEAVSRNDEEGNGHRNGGRNRGRDRGRDRNNNRNRDRGEHRDNREPREPREPRHQHQQAQHAHAERTQKSDEQPPYEEDLIGNIRRPGEAPAILGDDASYAAPNDNYDEDEDNIGNRLDAPPTSGHVGVNGEGVLGQQRNNSHGGGGHRNHRGGQGGGRHNNNRGGRNNRHRGGGGGRGPQGGGHRSHQGGGNRGGGAGPAQG